MDRPRTNLKLVRIHNVDARWNGRERKDTTIVVEREQKERKKGNSSARAKLIEVTDGRWR